MHDAVKDNIEKRARRVIAALKANNMEGWYLPDAAGVGSLWKSSSRKGPPWQTAAA